MTPENIKNYCQEALNITEQRGVEDGLAFLIGEKLSLVYYQLKTANNKLKYLYPNNSEENQKNPILKNNKTLQLNYTLTVNENYRGAMEQVELLEEVLEQFIREIKESFAITNIQDYLNSYPRLAFKENYSPEILASSEKSSPITTEDIFSEVEDILIINEIRNLFA